MPRTEQEIATELTNALNGDVWEDSNGHLFIISTITYDYTNEDGELQFQAFGSLECGENTNCDGWWKHVHNSPNKFPDYHARSNIFADETDFRKGVAFGWCRTTKK